MQQPRDELILIEALQQGSQKAFEQIYALYADLVVKTIEGIIHSPDDSQELSNDIFVNFWHNRDGIDRIKAIKRYLLKSARYAAFNFLKSKPTVEVNETIRFDDYLKDPSHFNEMIDDNHSEKSFYANELAIAIQSVVERMPNQRRVVFEKSRYEGLSNKEIAETMDLSIKTIEAHITLALKELKRITLVFFIIYCFTHVFRVGAEKMNYCYESAICTEYDARVSEEAKIA